MPFKSDAQRKLMYAVANNPAVAKKTSISKAVADKFIAHKAQGGSMKKTFRKDEDSAAYKAKERKHVAAMEKHGVPKNIIAEEKREAGLKKGGKVKGYAMGGPVVPEAPRSGIVPKEMMPVGPDGKPAADVLRYDSTPPKGGYGEPDMPMPPAGRSASAPPNTGAIKALLSRLPARGAGPTPMPGSDVVGGQGPSPEMVEKLGKVSPGISRGMAEAMAKAAMASQGRSQGRPGRVATPNTRFGGANRNQAYAKGGKVKSIDGCATKGKTKGTMR